MACKVCCQWPLFLARVAEITLHLQQMAVHLVFLILQSNNQVRLGWSSISTAKALLPNSLLYDSPVSCSTWWLVDQRVVPQRPRNGPVIVHARPERGSHSPATKRVLQSRAQMANMKTLASRLVFSFEPSSCRLASHCTIRLQHDPRASFSSR